MKKTILSLLVALMATTGANAQETLTVYDGTGTRSFSPAYMYAFDWYTRSQYIIPAANLEAMNGKIITALKYYSSTSNKTSTCNVDVYLKEVGYTTFNSTPTFETKSGIVYTGKLSIAGDGTLTITFTTPYTYNGGNLLIGMENTEKGNDIYSSFYGQNVTGAVAFGSNSTSLAAVTANRNDFIPKTTFTYTMPVPAGPTTSGITWDASTNSGTFDMPAYDVEVSTELWYKLDATETLDDNQTNYGMRTDFFLDRTLTKDVWNTFASPFAIPADKMETYFGAGAKVRKLDNTTVEEGYVLNLNFATATSIEAGKPYIVKPTAANVDFSADGKEFEGVDLTAAEATADVTTYVNFVPTLGKTTVTGDPENILMMTTEGKLVHPSALGNMKGFRGYFVMHDAAEARAFCVNFGDGETTGISSLTPAPSPKGEGSIYTLDGRRMNGQPTRKGMYIKSGKKVIIK